MTWQEPIVALIVGMAIVALWRHLRRLIGSAAPESTTGCHGCGDHVETSSIPLDQPSPEARRSAL